MLSERHADVVIIGGGLGGVAAAYSAARMGYRVILTEESDWLGGQLTAQGVPPDEHPWIETTGCTESYQRLRALIRDYYRRAYPLRPEVRAQVHLNPGLGAYAQHHQRAAQPGCQAHTSSANLPPGHRPTPQPESPDVLRLSHPTAQCDSDQHGIRLHERAASGLPPSHRESEPGTTPDDSCGSQYWHRKILAAASAVRVRQPFHQPAIHPHEPQ